MIPKVIHYCWFGGSPLPDLAQKCIASWKQFLPDYEIKEWNENNYDVRKIPYISQAYDAKKYAFVSDYARFDILYHHGGIYFDTDVEVIKPMNDILEKGAFMGLESLGNIASGLGVGAEGGETILLEILGSYRKSSFVDESGLQDPTTVVKRVSDIFRKHGYVDSKEVQMVEKFTIYPTEYFCPKSIATGLIQITRNTYTIHHYDGSWINNERKELRKVRDFIFSKYGVNFFSKRLLNMKALSIRLKNRGFLGCISYYVNRFLGVKE